MESTLNNISRKLAMETSFTGDTEKDAEILAYGMKIFLLNATALGGIILLAWPLGILKTTLLIWAAAYSLRIFAGGRHNSGPVTCWILTVTVFTSLGYMVNIIAPLVREYVLLIITFGLVFTLFTIITQAPVTIASKNFSPEKHRKLKMAAVAVVIFWSTVTLEPLNDVFNQPLSAIAIVTGLVLQASSIIRLAKNK